MHWSIVWIEFKQKKYICEKVNFQTQKSLMLLYIDLWGHTSFYEKFPFS